jgi:hypothetical protein
MEPMMEKFLANRGLNAPILLTGTSAAVSARKIKRKGAQLHRRVDQLLSVLEQAPSSEGSGVATPNEPHPDLCKSEQNIPSR